MTTGANAVPPSPAPSDAVSAALAERLLQAWMDTNPDYAVLVLDPQGRVLAARGAVENVLGSSPADLCGQPLTQIFTPEDRELAMHVHELTVASSAGRADDDRWHLRADGTRIWAIGSVTAIKGDDGKTLGFVKILRDRTDLRGQISALENRVSAQAAREREREMFLSSLGHELRNPLAPLSNAMQLIRLTDKEQRFAQPLRIIDRQLSTLTRLVDDLMDMARADIGKLALRPENIELHGAISAAVEVVAGAAQQKRLTIDVLLPSGPIVFEADRSRIEQVLVNLLNNAVKYTPAGGRIWVEGTLEGHDVVIRVADTGMGIAPDVLPCIFELFTQEARVSEAASGGLGIGLALVKNLVQAHRGMVEVRSDGQDKGSEFTVRLPLRQQP